jgi:phosphoribosylformylglycinamidine (FGAM) synthase PurS component
MKFDAESEAEALALVNKIASEVLVNELIEVYEIRALDEVNE